MPTYPPPPPAKLTIIIALYNMELYVADALDSILMQEADFPFKILVIDDCSTDKGLGIVKEYQKKHPGLIEINRNEVNKKHLYTWLKGYKMLDTPYFCVLDPDDYYLSPDKLQNAVSFLEKHPEYTVYASDTYIEEDGQRAPYSSARHAFSCSFHDMNYVIGHTSATVFRSGMLPDEMLRKIEAFIGTDKERCFEGDSFRNIVHIYYGKYYFYPKVESVYRITKKGIWTGMDERAQAVLNYTFYITMCRFFAPKNPHFFLSRCLGSIKQIYALHTERPYSGECISEYQKIQKEYRSAVLEYNRKNTINTFLYSFALFFSGIPLLRRAFPQRKVIQKITELSPKISVDLR